LRQRHIFCKRECKGRRFYFSAPIRRFAKSFSDKHGFEEDSPTNGAFFMSNTEKQQNIDISTAQAQQLAAVNNEPGQVLEVGGELNISDYVRAVPLSSKASDDLAVYLVKQHETTRTRLAMWIVKMFGSSLLATFLLVGVATFNPTVDKTLIKDMVPLVITSQSTLMATALGFYFGTKK
jgi:hypothetical protein